MKSTFRFELFDAAHEARHGNAEYREYFRRIDVDVTDEAGTMHSNALFDHVAGKLSGLGGAARTRFLSFIYGDDDATAASVAFREREPA